MMGLGGLLRDILAITGVDEPAWAIPLGMAALAAVLLPGYVRRERAARAQRLLTSAWASGSPAERDRLEAEALAEVRGSHHGRLIIARLALERGRYPLVRTALDGLAGVEAAAMRRKLEGDLPATREEADLRVSRLRESGAAVAAEELEGRIRERWG
jgi:hypothetical protein